MATQFNPTTKSELVDLIKNKTPCSQIDTSLITDMSDLFESVKDYPWDGIEDWNVSNVKNMSWMFGRSNFNGDISRWNVSNVENMNALFYESSFNGDISRWNVSNVRDMHQMFHGTPFNGDISRWDVSNVRCMDTMFFDSAFNGDISRWNAQSLSRAYKMFDNEKLMTNEALSQWIKNVFEQINQRRLKASIDPVEEGRRRYELERRREEYARERRYMEEGKRYRAACEAKAKAEAEARAKAEEIAREERKRPIINVHNHYKHVHETNINYRSYSIF